MEWQMFLTFKRNYSFIFFPCNFIRQDACSVGCCVTCVDVCLCSPPAAPTHGARNRCSLMIISSQICSSLTILIFLGAYLPSSKGRVQALSALPHCLPLPSPITAFCFSWLVSLTALTDGQAIEKPSSFLKWLDCWWLNQNVTASSYLEINNGACTTWPPWMPVPFFSPFFLCVCGLMGGGCLQFCVLPQGVASETGFNLGWFLW